MFRTLWIYVSTQKPFRYDLDLGYLVFFLNIVSYLLDVISITGGSQTHLDPFTAANNVYVDTFGIRPGNFLKNTAPVPDPDDRSKVYHNMKITLLPHQIIIFPHAILGNLDILASWPSHSPADPLTERTLCQGEWYAPFYQPSSGQPWYHSEYSGSAVQLYWRQVNKVTSYLQ